MPVDNTSLLWSLDPESSLVLSKNVKNKFWQEVITAWEEYKIAIEHTGSFLGYTFLFSTYVHNRNILYRERDFISHNCTRISDLLLPNGQIMNYADFIAKYKLNSVNYLDFYSLRKSVTNKWSCCFEMNFECSGQTYLDPLIEMKNFKRVCNKTYYKLLPRTWNVQSRVNKWNICLNTSLTLEDWEDVFVRSFKSSIDSKSRSFQYKVLNRILATNSFLKMCKITNSSLCTFCKVDEETVEHLFWYCTVIRKFWDDICTC